MPDGQTDRHCDTLSSCRSQRGFELNEILNQRAGIKSGMSSTLSPMVKLIKIYLVDLRCKKSQECSVTLVLLNWFKGRDLVDKENFSVGCKLANSALDDDIHPSFVPNFAYG